MEATKCKHPDAVVNPVSGWWTCYDCGSGRDPKDAHALTDRLSVENAALKEQLKLATERHQQKIEDFAYFPLSELGKESPEVSALKDRIAVLEGRNKQRTERLDILARGFERLMKIARFWREFAMKQAQRIAFLKAQHEGSFKEFSAVMERLQRVREQRDALIGLGAGIGIRECSKCEMPALLVSPAGAYCLSCRREIAAVDLEKLA